MAKPLTLTAAAALLLVAFFSFTGGDGAPSPPATDSPAPESPLPTLSSVTSRPARTAEPATLTLPPQDNLTLLAAARASDKRTGTRRFATRLPVHVTPDTHGRWTTSPDRTTSNWHLAIASPGATSLNLAFSQYDMPDGGQLTLASPLSTGQPRPFTHADNEPHGQLWTPVLHGDTTTITATVPASKKHALKLVLAAVNHGFRGLKSNDPKIGGDRTGSCNIDVACASAGLPVSPLIAQYADQVRASGAYTLNGTDTCSGALVNNTAGDGRPFFLTADHCDISPNNAPSMVVYWNFENSTCRTPGSSASGNPGDGPLTIFNSGAIFRATSQRSDFCLVELDDPIPAEANAFYAGWDRSGNPASSSVAVHHPAVAEKRISFDFDPTTTTDYFGNASPGDGTHIRVADWDHGTTEGGSSGSPLFDQDGRIIGQLHGGDAACGNDDSDWYGALSVSWQGGGNSASRLRDWLDPIGTNPVFIDGQNQDENLAASATDITEGPAGATTTLTFTVTLTPAAEETVTVTASTADSTATAGQDYTAVSGLLLTFPPGTTQQTVDVTITGDDTPEEHETVQLLLTAATNAFAASAPASARILNDDYITPVITNTGPLSAAVGRTLTFPITALNTPTAYSLTNPPTGASVDPATGQVSFTPAVSGTATLTLNATNPAATGTADITVNISDNPLLVALDLDPATLPAAFEDNGTPPWDLTTTTTNDGVDAARSATIGNGEASTIRLSFPGPEAVSFSWRVSSEPGYDYLQVLADGSVEDAISGTTDWRQKTIHFPDAGPHTLEIRYTKDGSDSEGSDAGWVDGLTFASTSNAPFPLSPPSATSQLGFPFSHQFTFFAPTTSLVATTATPPGLSFDPATATLSGTPSATGSSTFTVRAANGAATTDSTLSLLVIPPLNPAADLGDATPLTTSGDAVWTTTTTTTHDGIDAVRSGSIGDGENSDLSLTLTGPDTVAFWWRVSSELDFDFLELILDGQLQKSISGDSDWQQTSLKIPGGTHTITWRYSKDGSDSDGSDLAWVDQIIIASQLSAPVVLPAPDLVIELGAPFSYTPESLGDPTSFSAVNLPPGIGIDPDTGTLSGTPSTTGNFTATFIATNAAGSGATSLNFQVITPFGPAIGQPGRVFSTSGDAPWVIQTSTVHSPSAALRTGAITDSQVSALETVIVGPASGSFWWRTSSEEDFDFLVFYMDDLSQASLSGRSAWEFVSFDIPAGEHTLAWRYEKDSSDSEGADAGFLDTLTLVFPLTPIQQWLADNNLPTDTDPTTGSPPLLARYALGLPATSPATLDLSIVLNPDNSLTVFRDPAATGINVTVEASPDLTPGSWSATHLETVTDTSTRLAVRPQPGAPTTLYLRPRFTLQTP